MQINERVNEFPYIAGKNSCSYTNFSKAVGCTRFRVNLSCMVQNRIATGKIIELNCVLIVSETNGRPVDVYRQAKVFDENIDEKWKELSFLFTGFEAPQEYIITIAIERRNDTTIGTPSQARLFIRRLSGISEK